MTQNYIATCRTQVRRVFVFYEKECDMKQSRIAILNILIMSLLMNLPTTGETVFGNLRNEGFAYAGFAPPPTFQPPDDTFAITLVNNGTALGYLDDDLNITTQPLGGLGAGEQVTAFDTKNGDDMPQIFGVTNLGNFVEIDYQTGIVNRFGSANPLFTNAPAGKDVAADINPTTNVMLVANVLAEVRLYVDISGNNNHRIQPEAFYPPDDPNFGRRPNLSAIAYTVDPANTELFGIDSMLKAFVKIDEASGAVRQIRLLPELDIDETRSVGLDARSTDGQPSFSALYGSRFKTEPQLAEVDINGSLQRLRTTDPDVDTSQGFAHIFRRTGETQPDFQFVPIAIAKPDLRAAMGLKSIFPVGSSLLPGWKTHMPNEAGLDPSLDDLREMLKNRDIADIDFDRRGRRFLIANNVGVTAIETTSDGEGNEYNRAVEGNKNSRIQIDPDTKQVNIIEDMTFRYAQGDPNAGRTPQIKDMAYGKRDTPGEPPLYAMDVQNNAFSVALDATTGEFKTVAEFPFAKNVTGFDIDSNGQGFVVLDFPGQDKSWFYEIDLETGEISKIGTIGGEGRIKGLTLVGSPPDGPQISVDHVRGVDPINGTWDVNAEVTENGEPVSGIPIGWEVIEGPNQGKTGAGTTNNRGEVAFTYPNTSGVAGTDTILISGVSEGQTFSYTVGNLWTDAPVITKVVIKSSLNKVKIKGFNFRVPVVEVMINGQMVKFSVGNDTTMTLKKTRGAIGNCIVPSFIEIFADGFESGDISAWSAACP